MLWKQARVMHVAMLMMTMRKYSPMWVFTNNLYFWLEQMMVTNRAVKVNCTARML